MKQNVLKNVIVSDKTFRNSNISSLATVRIHCYITNSGERFEKIFREEGASILKVYWLRFQT